jgi:hypothetical protein
MFLMHIYNAFYPGFTAVRDERASHFLSLHHRAGRFASVNIDNLNIIKLLILLLQNWVFEGSMEVYYNYLVNKWKFTGNL